MLRVVDHALPLGGVALIVLGVTAWPLALPLGWTDLGLAFFAWVVASLRFEHHERVSYVQRRSLERALRAAGI